MPYVRAISLVIMILGAKTQGQFVAAGQGDG